MNQSSVVRGNYIPTTTIGVGKNAYCFFIVAHNIPSIISRESMNKHNFGQTLKLQSVMVTVNIRSKSLKSNSFFFVSKQNTCIYARLGQKKL